MAARQLLNSSNAWNLVRAATTTSTLPTSIAIAIRPGRLSDITFAYLLSRSHTLPNKPSVHIIATSDDLSTLSRLPDHQSTTSTLHTLSPSSYPFHDHDLQPYASIAVKHSLSTLILPETRPDFVTHALTSLDAGVPNAFMGGLSTGVEMLPSSTLTYIKPLLTFDESIIDNTISSLQLNSPNIPSETARASKQLGPISMDTALSHAIRKASTVTSLRDTSSDIINDAVLEASHWGYVVARRSTLAGYYHSGRTGRLATVHALSRIILHVSGGDHQLILDDEQVSRLASQLLSLDRMSGLVPLPKGRTTAGMVVRPATGRFAKRLSQTDRRKRRRPRENFGPVSDDLMILTREPDHESTGLFGTRLRGNFSCAPLPTVPDQPVYWDNRFVITAAPVEVLEKGRALIRPKDVLSAVLKRTGRTSQEDVQKSLYENQLYVRQIRRADWEQITGVTSRIKNFQIPFQCIRALPAIFQKKKQSNSTGDLIASPHLGLSARPDLFFTAIRMPRFRSLPPEIDPGFVENHFRTDEHKSSSGGPGNEHDELTHDDQEVMK